MYTYHFVLWWKHLFRMLTNQIIGECNTVDLIPLTGPINGESLLKYFATQRRFAVALLFWISFAVVFFPLHSKHRI